MIKLSDKLLVHHIKMIERNRKHDFCHSQDSV